MKNNSYLDSLVLEVKGKLPEYLREHGREVTNSGMFQCLISERHTHGDKNYSASATLQNDGIWIWHCHGCKESGTILDLANLVEGFPIRGNGFVTTITELAERYGIDVDYDQLGYTKDEVRASYSLSDVYKEIEGFIRDSNTAIPNLTNGKFGRKYTKSQAEQVVEWCSIGCIDPQALESHLVDKFGVEKVKALPFYNRDTEKPGIDTMVFGRDILTIAIRTFYGRTVGFVGRVSDEIYKQHTDKGKKYPKYKFTSGMAGKRSAAMFLMDINRTEIKRSRQVRIVEGQFDAVSMKLAGFNNVIGAQGSNFSTDQADVLLQLGVAEVIFILDDDKAGIRGVRKALTVLKNYHDIVVRAVPLPEGMDPDQVVSSNKLDLFKNELDAVEFILEKDPDFNTADKNPDLLYNDMIAFVANVTTSTARLRRYASKIAEKSSYQPSDAFDDLNKFLNRKEIRGHEAISVWNNVQKAESLPLAERAIVLKKAANDYSRMLAGTSDGIIRDTWEHYMSLLRNEKQLPTIIPTGFNFLDRATSFQCGTLSIISGRPSNGKSSLLRHTTLKMIEANPELFVLYITLDDQVETTMVTFLSLIAGMKKADTAMRMRAGTLAEAPEIRSVQDDIQRIFTHNLCIKGGNDCPDIMSVKKTGDSLRSIIKDRDMVIVIDALQNLMDVRGTDQRVAIENAISDLKYYAVESDSNIALVSQMKKLDETQKVTRPTLGSLKGSSFIEFEAKNVLLVHMDAHYFQSTDMVWRRNGIPYPIVEINVAKDKEKRANEILPFMFDPETGIFEEPSEAKLIQLRKAIQASVSGTGGQYHDDTSAGEGSLIY